MNKYSKIQGPRFQRYYIIARDQQSYLHGTSFQSSPKISRMLITTPFACTESLQHRTVAILVINILIFFSTTQNSHSNGRAVWFGKNKNVLAFGLGLGISSGHASANLTGYLRSLCVPCAYSRKPIVVFAH